MPDESVDFQTTVVATPPANTKVAVDTIAGVSYQRVKLDGGGDGALVPIVAGRQADAASLPVALSTEDVVLLSAVSSGGDSQSNRSVGASAAQGPNIAAKRGVMVRASRGNTSVVYVGLDNAITAGTTGATDGMPLSPGDALTIPVANANQLWVIGGAANQIVHYLAI